MKLAIHWFRRDLRVADNTALNEAAKRAELVVPVFILEDAFRTGPDVGAARLAFLLRSLEVLRENLKRLGCPLIVRRGRSEIELPKLCRQLGAEAVFCNRRYEPYAQARDERVFIALNGAGVGFEIFKDAVIWEDQEILTQAGKPYTVFTPYSKAWKKHSISLPGAALKAAKKTFPKIVSEPFPLDPGELGHPLKQSVIAAGEQAVVEALQKFLRGPVCRYRDKRDSPAEEGTSQLSAHLRCGTMGIRTVMAKLKASRVGATKAEQESCEVFLNELIWREFYLQVLTNFPHVMRGAFRPEYDALKWSENENHFQAWCDGRTGYPVVDAAMRCLNSTGWMHNRLRMVVAMFLTKDLLINWQWGERYFMKQLVDGDMAANNGGWQWSAGTGTDAAPYFRIFNPVEQGKRFDPKGEFVRRWVPELAGLPAKLIHEPWKVPAAKKVKYPQRIVIHAEQRTKCLAMFKEVRRKR